MKLSEPKIAATERLSVILAGALIVLLGFAAYVATFRVPFLFDDRSAIVENASIRHLENLSTLLRPPVGTTTSGRPFLNVTFAVNLALGGLSPTGYHVFNLAIHLLCAMTVFGIARRTFTRPTLSANVRSHSLLLGFIIAAIWMLHPVQTVSVIYVSQRAESLMGLFYLLTIYASVRFFEQPERSRWVAAAVATYLLALATKETAITAPLIVLLYDWTFLAKDYRSDLRKHSTLYLALGSASLVGVAWLLSVPRSDAGFDLGVHWYTYAWMQCEVVVRYLGLCLCPFPLVFDYGPTFASPHAASVIFAGILAVVLGLTVFALVRQSALGFCGASFFVALAPTSSVIPIIHQPMAENRLYVPLAAIVSIAVVGGYAWLGRTRFLVLAAIAIFASGVLTFLRNADYQNEVALWRDTLARVPNNARAHFNLAHALSREGDFAAAVIEYTAALTLNPLYPEAHNNLGNALSALGQVGPAIGHYKVALRQRTSYVEARLNLASALSETGDYQQAIPLLEAALEIDPGASDLHASLGSALAHVGRTNEAIAQFQASLRINPANSDASLAWGNLLFAAGAPADAIPHYQAAVHANPKSPDAHINLGNALLQTGHLEAARSEYHAALAENPRSAAAHFNLGNVELEKGDLANAIRHLGEAVRLDPNLVGAQHNLALALLRANDPAQAIPHFETTLRLMPGSAIAHHNLATALAQLHRIAEAISHEEAALRLQPDFPAARAQLERLRRD